MSTDQQSLPIPDTSAGSATDISTSTIPLTASDSSNKPNDTEPAQASSESALNQNSDSSKSDKLINKHKDSFLIIFSRPDLQSERIGTVFPGEDIFLYPSKRIPEEELYPDWYRVDMGDYFDYTIKTGDGKSNDKSMNSLYDNDYGWIHKEDIETNSSLQQGKSFRPHRNLHI
jgi:hypothetical protein